MKHSLRCTALLIVLMCALGWTLAPKNAAAQEKETEPPPLQGGLDRERTLRVLVSGELRTMDMAEYLTGVLRAEMPASFELEALKAQAVAARTFTLKTLRSGAHGGAVCDQSACCQAWLSEAQLRARFGTSLEEAQKKADRAIARTDGVVACYDGKLIDAVYFSCSGGRTEDALAVWGSEVAYLRSVESPGEEDALHDIDEVEIPLAQFRAALLEQAPESALDGAPGDWFGAVRYSTGGGVETMEIGGVQWSGTQLRALFGLRSTAFTVTVGETAVRFQTRGYGHRVGMSQYGARAMADAGATYGQILQHYYTGIRLKTLAK